MPLTPEQLAREQIDQQLESAGWVLQDVRALNLAARRGIAVREFPLVSGYGFADYLLYVDRIVAEVERRLSIVDQMETAMETNLKRAQRLRQAILKRAFEGKLVPQDPNDEPAGALLARIRAERAQRRPKSPNGKHLKLEAVEEVRRG